MSSENEMTSLPPRALLDQAREFVERHTNQSGQPVQQSQVAVGNGHLAASESGRATSTSLFEFAQRLSTAVLAMESHIRVLYRTAPDTVHSGEKVAAHGDARSPAEREAGLRVELNEMRDIIGHLLVTAEPSWEKGPHSRDWKEAMDRARAALSVGFNR